MKLAIVQPALAHYRVPVFHALAQRPGIDLKVLYGQGVGAQNVEPDGFDAELRPIKRTKLLGQPIYWHPAQLEAMSAGFDAVILTWDVHYLSLLPALRKGKRNGVGTVLWGHGVSRRDRGWAGKPKYWVAGLADALLLYTEANADVYRKRGFENAFAAPNTIDVSAIDAARIRDPQRIAAFKAEQGISGRVLLHVSRISGERRVDMLLDAAAGLPDVHVVIVGKGDAIPALREQAERLGMGGRVTFTGPLFGEETLAPWYAIADAVVMPSFGGLGILSALAFGVPVIAGDDPLAHGPEVQAIRHGENGMLFRHGDVAELTAKINAVPDSRLAEGALRTMREEFSIASMVDGIVDAVGHSMANKGR